MSEGSRNLQGLARVPCAISSTFSSLSAAVSSPCSNCPWSCRSSSNSFNRLVSARRTACTAGVSSATTSGQGREQTGRQESQDSHSFFPSALFLVGLTLLNTLYLFQIKYSLLPPLLSIHLPVPTLPPQHFPLHNSNFFSLWLTLLPQLPTPLDPFHLPTNPSRHWPHPAHTAARRCWEGCSRPGWRCA